MFGEDIIFYLTKILAVGLRETLLVRCSSILLTQEKHTSCEKSRMIKRTIMYFFLWGEYMCCVRRCNKFSFTFEQIMSVIKLQFLVEPWFIPMLNVSAAVKHHVKYI